MNYALFYESPAVKMLSVLLLCRENGCSYKN
ncbi:protein of unknown function [Pseudomonas inefficax]|uniref:Uncharacterized protein n=1 Tax=Pseudomonas inefficax TaxID=2078786 RepID=A0AAQ1STR8_9PSED|nr:protein of unknown function [Pseudomonas inefficax]